MVYGVFMCFTWWQHYRSTGIYCRLDRFKYCRSTAHVSGRTQWASARPKATVGAARQSVFQSGLTVGLWWIILTLDQWSMISANTISHTVIRWHLYNESTSMWWQWMLMSSSITTCWVRDPIPHAWHCQMRNSKTALSFGSNKRLNFTYMQLRCITACARTVHEIEYLLKIILQHAFHE